MYYVYQALLLFYGNNNHTAAQVRAANSNALICGSMQGVPNGTRETKG